MADKSVGKILDKKASSAIRKGGGSISEEEMIKIMLDSGKESGLFKKMEMGGKVKKMEDGGKAVPVAKVKIERLKKMRDPYGESNFAHQISDGKDAYTQRVIAAMKESGQPFMDGGKVEKMNYGGKVKKMNMGGVVPGRGGSFKGVR
jgi:CRISPR/Cas system-associated protein Csx1